MDWEKVDVGDDTIGSFVFLSSSASKIKDDDKITNPSHSLVKIGNSSHTLIITDYQNSISNHDHYMDPKLTDHQTKISNPNQNINVDLKNIDLTPNSEVQPEWSNDTWDKLNNSLLPTNSNILPEWSGDTWDKLTNSLIPTISNIQPEWSGDTWDKLTNSLKPNDQVYNIPDPLNPPNALTNSLYPLGDLINSLYPPNTLTNSLNPPDILTNSLNSLGALTNSLYPPDTLTNSLKPHDQIYNIPDPLNPPNTLTNSLNSPVILTNSLKPHDQIDNIIDPTLTTSQKYQNLVKSPQSDVHGEGPYNEIINNDGPKDSDNYSKFIKDVYKDQPITVNTSISVLEGIDDSVAEILETQASVRGLGALVSLPVDIYNFIKESGLVVDLERLIQNASALLVEAERISPTTETQDGDSIKLQESAVHPFPIENNSLNDKAPEPLDIENLPITILKGINNDEMALSLEKHAFIFTVGELAAFPTNWPGIYHMIKESDMLPELDVYIDIAKKWILTGREPNLESETIDKN